MKQAVPDANVIAVGMIYEPAQAEAIIFEGKADFVAIARAVLDDPNWPHHAATALGQPEGLPNQYARATKTTWPAYDRIHGR